MEKIDINSLTIEEKVGQMLMFSFFGTEYNEQLDYFIKKLHLGGVAHFSRNIISPDQACKLNNDIQKNSKIPLFIGLDQEGGTVQRLIKGVTPFPGAMALAATNESNRELCRYVGTDLKNMNYNMVFAPVADVNNNPLNPVINSRSYSDNPEVVAKYATDAFKGFEEALILPTAKHFPGHGDTSVDSHLSLPMVNKTMKELELTELVPFKKVISEGIDGVMVSHIMYPAFDEKYPATLSYNIMTKYLKKDLNYQGLLISDSLTMGAIYNNYSLQDVVRLSVNGGMDILMFCGKADLDEQKKIYDYFLDDVKEGIIPIERINESVEKILKFKEKYCEDCKKEYVSPIPEAMALGTGLSEKSITMVKSVDNIIPLKDNDKILVIFPKIKLFSLVDNDDNQYATLGNVFKKYHIDVDEIIVSDDLSNLFHIRKIANNYSKIVLATYNVREKDYQTQIFSILDKSKTIVASMRSPYDIKFLNGVETYFCIYEATDLALNSLVKVLLGQKELIGKIPVKIN